MTRFGFAEGRVNALRNLGQADPQRLGEELDAIRRAHSGHLKPEDVLKRAKDRSSSMHKHFDWDDSVAAHRHRLAQARAMIRAIVRLEGEEQIREIPAFVSIRAEDNGRTYRATTEVLGSAHLRRALLKQAERDLIAFQTRYRRFEDLAKAVDDPIKIAQDLIRREAESEEN